MQTEMQELIEAAEDHLLYSCTNTKGLRNAISAARKASEGGWIGPGSCKNCGHSEHGKCMAWAGNGLGWCKCENYEPVPLLSLETPEVTS